MFAAANGKHGRPPRDWALSRGRSRAGSFVVVTFAILVFYAELQAILASYTEGPALTAEQLQGSSWKFFDLNGRLLSSSLLLAGQELLENPGTDTVGRWRMVNGQLCFAATDGAPAVIFKLVRTDEQGRLISFAGQGVIDGVQTFYFLRLA